MDSNQTLKPMQQYSLEDEHKNPNLEQRVLSAISKHPQIYWELDPPGRHFACFRDSYEDLKERIRRTEETAIEEDPDPVDPPEVAEETDPAEDPKAAVEELKELAHLRDLARLEETVAEGLQKREDPASILKETEETAAKLRSGFEADRAGRLRSTGDILSDLLEEAEEARQHFQETGEEVRGVETGIEEIDDVLGGLKGGEVTYLAGPPGVGKTSLALQIAAEVSDNGTPVLFVSFENSPSSLALKGMSHVGGVNPTDVRRGRVALSKTKDAAEAWKQKARNLWILEGRGDLSPSHLRGKARRTVAKVPEADRCLVVVDYIQRYAKACTSLRGAGSARERVEVMSSRLQDMAGRLSSPVLSIASQNRSAGYGGDGGSSASMSTLKESGDLEYDADVVAILSEDPEREVGPDAKAVNFVLPKNRNGEADAVVELVFRPDRGTMRPVSRRSESGGPAGTEDVEEPVDANVPSGPDSGGQQTFVDRKASAGGHGDVPGGPEMEAPF
jgi:replicative DNA helicase